MSIQSEINRIKNDKETLITNLEAIGIDIAEGAKLSDVSTNIIESDALDTSDATVTASDIMLNKTAYAKGLKVTGTFTIDEELAEQNELISQIVTLVNQKANPSSGNTLETCDVTITYISSGGLGLSSTQPAAICYPVERDYYLPLYEIETPITITVVKNSIICIYDTNYNGFGIEHSGNIESFGSEYSNFYIYRITGDATITIQ